MLAGTARTEATGIRAPTCLWCADFAYDFSAAKLRDSTGLEEVRYLV